MTLLICTAFIVRTRGNLKLTRRLIRRLCRQLSKDLAPQDQGLVPIPDARGRVEPSVITTTQPLESVVLSTSVEKQSQRQRRAANKKRHDDLSSPTGGSPNGVPCCPYESRQRYDQLSVYNDNTTRMSFSSDEMRFKSILLDDRVTRPSHKECIFVDKYYPPPTFGSMKLQPDAARSLTVPNAGGQSVLSEMLSIQYMTEIYGAKNVILEEEVEYFVDYKMIDYICTVQAVDGRDSRVGVSVTRAMGFPTPERFTRAWADSLLAKKLYGLIVARNGVNDNHTFFKSILHCWAQTQQIADYVREAYEALDVNDYGLNIKGDVLLVVTVCDNPYIYSLDRSHNYGVALS